MNASEARQPVVMVVMTGGRPDYHRGIARHAQARSWHLVYDSLFLGTIPSGCRIDGLLIGDGAQGCVGEVVRSLQVPFVSINTIAVEQDAGAAVVSDMSGIGLLAAEHFIQCGFRNFAWAPFTDDGHNQARAMGFEAALREFGHGVHFLPPVYHRRAGGWLKLWEVQRDEVVAALRGLPKGTAILAYNDCVATEVIKVCLESGLKVPGDIAVLGVDNDPLYADNLSVSLSSIDIHMEELGYQAALLLDQLMSKALVLDRLVSVPPKGVVARLSTGSLEVQDVRIQDALKYIYDNYMNPVLGVQDVADAVHLSRRALERAFRIQTGKTVSDYIVTIRMQEAARLLRTHDRAKVFDVAGMVGFGAPTNFFRRFRRHFGVTPKEYMRQIEVSPARKQAC